MPQINAIILLAGKFFTILGTLIYLVFSIVIVKQVNSMSHNIYDKFNAILIAFSYIHLLFSVLLIILAVVFL